MLLRHSVEVHVCIEHHYPNLNGLLRTQDYGRPLNSSPLKCLMSHANEKKIRMFKSPGHDQETNIIVLNTTNDDEFYYSDGNFHLLVCHVPQVCARIVTHGHAL
jgi:hypothetical protein